MAEGVFRCWLLVVGSWKLVTRGHWVSEGKKEKDPPMPASFSSLSLPFKNP